MINLSGVRAVQARITQLQERFGMPRGVPGMDFQNTLKREMQKTEQAERAQAAPTAVTSAKKSYPSYSVNQSLPLADQSLSTMIDEAARKDNVDPKRVAAVAEVESGGNQN